MPLSSSASVSFSALMMQAFQAGLGTRLAVSVLRFDIEAVPVGDKLLRKMEELVASGLAVQELFCSHKVGFDRFSVRPIAYG